MDFIFHITNYDDPALDAEAAELLRQRLEAKSRQTVPGMWRVTDRLNARASKGPGRETRRRYRVYGVLLMALGVFALVPGLMEPQIPAPGSPGSPPAFGPRQGPASAGPGAGGPGGGDRTGPRPPRRR